MEDKKQILKQTSVSLETGTEGKWLSKETYSKTMMVLSIHFQNLYKPEQLQALLPAMYELLKDLTPKRLENGLKRFLVLTEEIYPNTNIASKIRRHALLHNFPTAAEEWEIRDQANYRADITTKIIQSMGGLYALGKSENPMADRAHFLKMFNEIAEVEKKKILMGDL